MSADKNSNKNSKGKNEGKSARGSDKNIKGKPMSPSEARFKRKADDEKVVKRVRLIFISIIVIAVIGIAAGVYLSTYQPTVAWIGKESIKLSEFNYFLSVAKMGVQDTVDTGEIEGDTNFWDSSIEGGTTVLGLAKENALNNAQETKIYVAKAKEQGLKLDSVETEYIKSLIDNMINAAGGDRAAASEEAKSTYGTTLSELKKVYEQMFLSEKSREAQAEMIVVTDEEAQTMYDENITDYDYATVSHILISYEGSEEEPRTPEESQELANEVLGRVNAGEDFASLVEELTDDTASISTGGEYTFTRNEGYAEEFTNWSFEANVGDVGIVETEFGYHIMRLDNREITPFEDVKDNFLYNIRQTRLTELYEGWASEPQYEKRINDSVYPDIA